MNLDENITLEFMRRLPALSIRQPWAWYIVRPDLTDPIKRAAAIASDEMKPVENRDWSDRYAPIHFRGQFLIHASKGMTRDEYVDANMLASGLGHAFSPAFEGLQRGGIVGVATVTDVVSQHESGWFGGPVALVLTDVWPLAFVACRGSLGFFRPEAIL